MRGIYTSVTDIRRKVFTEVARMAYEGGDYAKKIEELPYKIIPGEIATYRESIFLERAIVGERLRLCIGLPLRPVDENKPISDGIFESAIAEKYYDPPLVNIISFACNKCPEKKFEVTNLCQGCLAHPCSEVCPKGAISFDAHGKSVIDQEKCIKCGRCRTVCPYGAIQKMERPCAKACGMNAIGSDEHGRAQINYDLCVSCGMCIVNCPFGAISDKGQIFQLIQSIKKGDQVIAAVAPAFLGQFGPKATPEKIKDAMRHLGFADVVEVAVGADLCTIEEAEDFLKKVPEEQPFMATSCCPSWSVMAKKLFPEFAPYISMALTPMVLTARLIKKEHPDCKVVFVGPCSAKKLEASRRSIRSDVDFVLTFEEIMGMFEAKNIDFNLLEGNEPLNEGTGAGRGFAVSGGVANAVVEAIKKIDPDREVQVDYAEGLENCKKMLTLAKAGKRNGFLLEGMGCPGGCVAGAGTLQPVAKSTAAVAKYKSQAEQQNALDSKYAHKLKHLD
ncbi:MULTISPECIES: 4Fe-4S dicluster domain-containing protein [Clostridiaceae]|uniref:4Fe-4S dicluster domain-containing protein n=1 Tax=Clostridium facile TaxID=2763035 RepID=A0ABR7IRT3_9CLOT|nr:MULTISPECIES: 4Fe-4S dicluster domain-containing protein [Clostridiaceae]MBC5787854.1 4Fe-4S dicluster domain-containing protein [Clostridium facile]